MLFRQLGGMPPKDRLTATSGVHGCQVQSTRSGMVSRWSLVLWACWGDLMWNPPIGFRPMPNARESPCLEPSATANPLTHIATERIHPQWSRRTQHRPPRSLLCSRRCWWPLPIAPLPRALAGLSSHRLLHPAGEETFLRRSTKGSKSELANQVFEGRAELSHTAPGGRVSRSE